MNDDARLRHLVRASLAPAETFAPGPRRDLWPSIEWRVNAPDGLAWFDLILLASVALLLVVFPDWLLLLALHF